MNPYQSPQIDDPHIEAQRQRASEWLIPLMIILLSLLIADVLCGHPRLAINHMTGQVGWVYGR